MSRFVVAEVAKEVLLAPWRNPKAFVIPFALVSICLVAQFSIYTYQLVIWSMTGNPSAWQGAPLLVSIFVMVGGPILISWAAVACHQLVLLNGPYRTWLSPKRVAWIAMKYLFLYLLTLLVAWATRTLVREIVFGIIARGEYEIPLHWIWVPDLIAWLPAAYIAARFCLILPAIAIGKSASIEWAWKVSRGVGWRLALTVFAIPAIAVTAIEAGGTDFALPLVGFFVRQFSIPAELGQMATEQVSRAIFAAAGAAFGVVALSFSYLALTTDDAVSKSHVAN